MIRALIFAALLAAPALADALRVIDGDTFDLNGTRYRIENIDTPELRARCEREAVLAYLAKRRLAELLRGRVVIVPEGRDRYGRTLARVYSGGRDVAEIMVSEGLAREWRGRREGWCNG